LSDRGPRRLAVVLVVEHDGHTGVVDHPGLGVGQNQVRDRHHRDSGEVTCRYHDHHVELVGRDDAHAAGAARLISQRTELSRDAQCLVHESAVGERLSITNDCTPVRRDCRVCEDAGCERVDPAVVISVHERE
jgi:hypothetical protein